MKVKCSSALLVSLIVIVVLAFGAVGCADSSDGFVVSGHENNGKIETDTLSTTEDIVNLVTDDDKLVINYFDAYTWVVFFDENRYVENMIYIYKFDSAEAAEDMLSTRKEELEINKTMTVTEAKTIENYIIIYLDDTSFTNVTREMLENNFSQMIV